MRKWFALLIVLVLVTNILAFAAEKEKLMVYTSMKETLIGELRDGFIKKYPEVQFDYYSAGAGKIMAKIAAERQSGRLATDILWTSEVPDFYQLKKQGLLQKYVSPEAKYIVSPLTDPDSEFVPARLGTLGITYNTTKIKKAPTSWNDLLKKDFADGFAIADPSLSGTACVSVAMLVNTFGWDYIEKLKANGAKMGQGSGQVVDDTASGDLKACIGVDYITLDKVEKGANIKIAFPKEMLVVPSPVAIFKGTSNLKAAQKFIDYLLSKDGQTVIAKNYTLPIRRDVSIVKGVGLVEPSEAVKRAMKLDYVKMIGEKEATIDRFTKIMQGK